MLNRIAALAAAVRPQDSPVAAEGRPRSMLILFFFRSPDLVSRWPGHSILLHTKY